jgi:hypothetical protein
MMAWMSMELIGSVDVGCHLVGFWLMDKLGKSQMIIFVQP